MSGPAPGQEGLVECPRGGCEDVWLACVDGERAAEDVLGGVQHAGHLELGDAEVREGPLRVAVIRAHLHGEVQ
eukprot:9051632-Alexandrium_andersonii.AAC.1